MRSKYEYYSENDSAFPLNHVFFYFQKVAFLQRLLSKFCPAAVLDCRDHIAILPPFCAFEQTFCPHNILKNSPKFAQPSTAFGHHDQPPLVKKEDDITAAKTVKNN